MVTNPGWGACTFHLEKHHLYYLSQMKNILKFTLLSFTATLISSCAIVNFVPYSGKQQNWPTASGGFVQTHNEFKIYKGFPERPYTILGELIIEQYPQYMNAEIASAGKKHKADAAIIVDSSTVNGGSMNFGGGGTTVYQGQSII